MILDNRLNDFDESLSPPTPCTVASTETANSCQRLYDSTNTLCSGGRFSSLADEESNDEDEEEEEEEDQTAGLGVRSSSFSALRLGNQKATLVETPSKKIVRFADMMVSDTPPPPPAGVSIELLNAVYPPKLPLPPHSAYEMLMSIRAHVRRSSQLSHLLFIVRLLAALHGLEFSFTCSCSAED